MWGRLVVSIIFASAALCTLRGMAQSVEDPVVLRFGARSDAAPLSYFESGEWKGYSIELCERIFDTYQKMNAKQKLVREWRPVLAKDRFEALDNGEIDILCGATTVTIEKMKNHRFTLLTFISGAGVMKRKDTSIEQLQSPKKQEKKVRVSVVEGTTTEERVRSLLGHSIALVPMATHDKAFQALQDGTASFYFGDREMLRERLKHAEDRDDFVLAPGYLSYEPYAIPVSMKNDSLHHAANKTLARLYRDREIQKIYRDWFGEGEMSPLLTSLFDLMRIPEGEAKYTR